MTLYYECSDGTIIDLMGGDIVAQKPETLASNSWEYTSISGVGGIGKIKSFYKDTQEAKLLVAILADNKDSFNAILYQMHKCFDRDIRSAKPGKLWWNSFYKEVFAIDNDYEEFEELFESVEKTITFVSVYPYWVRETKYVFFPAEIEEEHTGFDYMFDYMFDYGISGYSKVITNECIEASNFKIRFYGPFQNPYITIGENTYRLTATLASGEHATIDSKTKKITQVSAIGEETNIFNLRDRKHYIFTKIPEGSMPVTKPKSLGVEIMVYDERGEPDWI